MRVLVTYADDDGASADTARLISDTLVLHGLHSVLRPVGTNHTDQDGSAASIDSTAGFDAVILGSTALTGRWRRHAVQFATAQQHHLRRLPVWLFSNSPAGTALTPQPPVDLGTVEDALSALDHRPFLAVTAPAAPWTPRALEPDPAEVCGWAHTIATTLQQTANAGT
ncbi:hypothetical protein ACQP00_20900 [Dactylosporangium sp. CS-047395]|uniref:hypothetical protein n=1 Tax=Dactylosporangium sp. CS-047395 TaxID=3239936 RepID=UPI003D91E7C5